MQTPQVDRGRSTTDLPEYAETKPIGRKADNGCPRPAGSRKVSLRPDRTETRFGCRKRYIEPVVIRWSCDMSSRPRDLADRMAGRRKLDDGFLRETFTLPRDKARTRARDFLTRYPKAAYMSGVESWRELPDGDIEFTMRRLRSAD
jgi:hypothetical protein